MYKQRARIRVSEVETDEEYTKTVVKKILSRAYINSKPQKRLLVLINPHGGQGKAKSIYTKSCEPFLLAAKCEFEVIETKYRYHAMEICKKLDLTEYDAIVCCSGDGIPHEVLNGFSQRENDSIQALKGMAICQLPCGSGNSLAVSLNGSPSPTHAALDIIKGSPMPVDLMRFSQPSQSHPIVTFLSQTYGLVADCDLGTENLRWMGAQRFTVGAVMKSLSQQKYPCEIWVKYAHEHKSQVKTHFHEHVGNKLISPSLSSSSTNITNNNSGSDNNNNENALPPPKFGTINDPVPDDWVKMEKPDLGLFYVGKLPWVSADALVFPASLPTDGTLDLVSWDATGGRLKNLDLLIKVEKGHHFHLEDLQYSKIEGYRLVPHIEHGYLSVDGESYPLEPFQVEVLPAMGCFLSASESGAYAKTRLHQDIINSNNI